MTKRLFGGVIVAGLLIASGSASAHHSLAATYDIKSHGQVTGVLTKVAFTNPHGAMTLEVDNGDGTKTEWTMTTGSANTLQNLGFGKGGPNTVKPGDTVTITYYAARNGKPLGYIRSITLPDSREIQLSNGSGND
jgi:DNA/RNA endonuclease YhcR with UshA esterase domain